jgi:hypothetical protein
MPLGILPVSLAMELYGAEKTLFVLALILFAVSVISVVMMKQLRKLG